MIYSRDQFSNSWFLTSRIASRLFSVFFVAISLRLQAQEANLTYETIPNTQPKNVIFILSDDHRYDYMGFMNTVPWLETPALDRLAREGAHCENAFVTTSLCSPSRASILTGQFSHVHTVVDNSAPAPKDLIYFPQYLQKENYQTAFVGKWHMGRKDDSPRPGFDHWVSFLGQGVYYNPTINVNGKRVKHQDSAYIANVLTDYAIDWIDQRNAEQPFFLYLSHKSVHSEFAPAGEDHYDYHGKEIPYPTSMKITDPEAAKIEGVNYEKIPIWVKRQRHSWHGVDYAYHGQLSMDTVVWRYTESLTSMDRQIDRLLDYLDEEGLAENTLIIYMGDNGFSFGEHGLIDKRHMYEESIRVPMLVRAPDLVEGGKKIKEMIQNIDIAPTILALAGIQKPEQMNGRSFLPLLAGKSVEGWRDRIFYEYYWEHDFPQTPTTHGVRTDRYKYIRYQGVWDTNEFYDLQEDPEEMNNLIESPQHQEIIKELVTELYDWLENTDGMQIPLKRTIRYRFGDYINKGY